MVRSVILVLSVLFVAYAGLVSAYRLSVSVKRLPDAAPLAVTYPYEKSRIYKEQIADRLARNEHDIPIQAKAISLFYEAPLDTGLFVTNLLFSLGSRNFDRAERIAAHVLNLDPRSEVALLTKLNQDSLAASHDAAVARIDRLMELDGGRGEIYINLAANLYVNPESRPAVLDALKKRPEWGEKLVATLIKALPGNASLLETVRPYPDLHTSYVTSLFHDASPSVAYAAFLSLLPGNEQRRSDLLYNGGFESKPGARPFNWTASRDFANFISEGGLSVSYYGQKQPTIASQVLKLDPGAYSFQYAINGSLHQFGGHIQWTLACLDSKSTFGAQDITELTRETQQRIFRFTVPETGCPFQRLRLKGVAGTFPRTLRATIHSASIIPENEAG